MIVTMTVLVMGAYELAVRFPDAALVALVLFAARDVVRLLAEWDRA